MVKYLDYTGLSYLVTEYLQDRITSFKQDVTLLANNWEADGDYYSYTILNAGITEDNMVDFNMDLANQAKIKDGYTETYTGYVKIYTSEAPTENISAEMIIQGNIIYEEATDSEIIALF